MNNKVTMILLVGVLLAVKTNSQITKGNWIVGGSGRYSSDIVTQLGEKNKVRTLDITTNEGYFFADKFAGGIILDYLHQKEKRLSNTATSSNFGIGPFIRYYFLPENNRINILAQTAYKYSRSKGSNGYTDTQNDLLFSAGPVLFFNQSIGFELTANYDLYNQKVADRTAKTFYVAIGFQIHLEKDKN